METWKGLVIREVNYRDNDKIITILTKERGKISASVPGGRSIKSKRLAGTGLFCYSVFSLTEKGGRYTVSQVQLMESFYGLREQVERVSLAYYIADLLGSVTAENLESGEALSLTLNTLYMLTKPGADLRKIKGVYELRLLSIMGHMPDLVACSGCAKYDGNMFFLMDEGCLLCPDCAPKGDLSMAVELNDAVLTAMRYIIYAEDKKIFSFQLGRENMEYLGAVIERYTLYRLDRSFSTLEFLHTMWEGSESLGKKEEH